MHEVGIATRIVEAAVARAAEAGAARVTAMHVELGSECGVSEEALRFHVPAQADGTPAAGAELTITEAADPFAMRLLAIDAE